MTEEKKKSKIDLCYLMFEKIKTELNNNQSFEFGLSLGLLISNITVFENMDCKESKDILRKNILESNEGKLFTLIYSDEINEKELIEEAKKLFTKN